MSDEQTDDLVEVFTKAVDHFPGSDEEWRVRYGLDAVLRKVAQEIHDLGLPKDPYDRRIRIAHYVLKRAYRGVPNDPRAREQAD